MRSRLVKIAIGVGVVLALLGGGAAAARATGSFDDEDPALTGPSADRARAAALNAVEGAKSATAESDDDNAYEVEVTRADGTTVDVDVNEAFEVVAVAGAENPNAPETEDTGPDDDGTADDDTGATEDDAAGDDD